MINQPSELSPETWEMLARYLAGESAPEESVRVRAWLAEDPSHAELVTTLGSFLNRWPNRAAADVDVDAALHLVKSRRLEERRGTPWRTNLIRIAAAVVLVLGASLIWRAASTRSHSTPIARAETYTTQPGQRTTVRLADGTAVVLGPGSRLALPADYQSGNRSVALSGEALFDVKHDAAHPFTVKADGATIRDVGTTFAVHSDPGEPVHVAVRAGSVVLHATGQAESAGVVLRAGQHAIMQTNGQVIAQAESTGDDDLAFTRGQLILENASLEHVATELRRWYGIELKYDEALTNRHVTASFQGETVDQALRVIGLALGARIEQNGNTAILHTH